LFSGFSFLFIYFSFSLFYGFIIFDFIHFVNMFLLNYRIIFYMTVNLTESSKSPAKAKKQIQENLYL